MTKNTEDFAKLVAELVNRIEAARVECQRMRTILNRKHDELETFEEPATARAEGGIVVNAAARFTASRKTASIGA